MSVTSPTTPTGHVPKPTTFGPSKARPSPTAAFDILETQVPYPSDFDATSQMFDLNGPPKHNPAGPRPDQIVLLTATDGRGHNAEVKNIVDMALHNRREYCAQHGYINHFINVSRIDIHARPVWKKLPAIIETFQTYPDALWVWWLDLDAIIMTSDFAIEKKILSDAALEKILLKNKEYRQHKHQGLGVFTAEEPKVHDIDLLVAQDHDSINAGSFMLRRSQATQMLLEKWRDPVNMHHGFPMEEQDALIHMIATDPQIRKHVGLVDAHVLNAFWSGWSVGDLLIHFAGCWTNGHCQRNWNAVWKKRYGTLEFPPPENGSAVVAAGAGGKQQDKHAV